MIIRKYYVIAFFILFIVWSLSCVAKKMNSDTSNDNYGMKTNTYNTNEPFFIDIFSIDQKKIPPTNTRIICFGYLKDHFEDLSLYRTVYSARTGNSKYRVPIFQKTIPELKRDFWKDGYGQSGLVGYVIIEGILIYDDLISMHLDDVIIRKVLPMNADMVILYHNYNDLFEISVSVEEKIKSSEFINNKIGLALSQNKEKWYTDDIISDNESEWIEKGAPILDELTYYELREYYFDLKNTVPSISTTGNKESPRSMSSTGNIESPVRDLFHKSKSGNEGEKNGENEEH